MQRKLVGSDITAAMSVSSRPFGRATLDDIEEDLQIGVFGPRGPLALVRVDWNVSDDTRIRASLPTIRWLAERGARIVVISHNGRPEGSVVPNLSLGPATIRAQELAPGLQFTFAGVLHGADLIPFASKQTRGTVLVLENSRFDARDEDGNITLASDIFHAVGVPSFVVIDGFAAAHRPHASVTGIANYASGRGAKVVMGRLMEAELRGFEPVLHNTPRPAIAVVGGAKISGDGGKLKILEGLAARFDAVIIGGAMAWAFLTAEGHRVGEDPLGRDPTRGEAAADIEAAKNLLRGPLGNKFVLPSKLVFGNSDGTERRDFELGRYDTLSDGFYLRDVHPTSVAKMLLDQRTRFGGAARLILWNGPMGAFEEDRGGYMDGTRELVSDLAYFTSADHALTIVGGGHSVQAIKAMGFRPDQFTHVSTGEGASLELIENGMLPGIDVLTKIE